MFINRLESLRGLAALMVAIGHSFIVLSVDGIPNIWSAKLAELSSIQEYLTKFLLVIFNGAAAVTIFLF
jgi:peptidoglycan/LPS O-acetylase OafA/YrhL